MENHQNNEDTSSIHSADFQDTENPQNKEAVEEDINSCISELNRTVMENDVDTKVISYLLDNIQLYQDYGGNLENLKLQSIINNDILREKILACNQKTYNFDLSI